MYAPRFNHLGAFYLAHQYSPIATTKKLRPHGVGADVSGEKRTAEVSPSRDEPYLDAASWRSLASLITSSATLLGQGA